MSASVTVYLMKLGIHSRIYSVSGLSGSSFYNGISYVVAKTSALTTGSNQLLYTDG